MRPHEKNETRKPERRHILRRRKDVLAPTAWQGFGGWYHDLVGSKGHYYHQKIVLPGALRLMGLRPGSSLLDLACGQGILSRHLPKKVEYWGVDASTSLLEAARTGANPKANFVSADITRALPIGKRDFSHASIILALQNVERPADAIAIASSHLCSGGRLLIVLNHPCFRIPRQSGWGIDDPSDTQYRRLDAYRSPNRVPMRVHPGQGERSPVMWSFHHPLEFYFAALSRAGFSVLELEEWISDKTSIGSASQRENRARKEFPLFLAILARKERKPKPRS